MAKIKWAKIKGPYFRSTDDKTSQAYVTVSIKWWAWPLVLFWALTDYVRTMLQRRQ